NGHYTINYNSIVTILPCEGTTGAYYLITHSKLVGIITKWENTSSLVIRVNGATFRSIASVKHGWKAIEDAISASTVQYL
ncbi:hypothetical protein V8B97DRAFT_1872685, partial [Scleroderma yunnanense]